MLRAEKEARDAKERQKQRAADKIQKERERKEAEEKEKIRKMRNYEDVVVDESANNQGDNGNLSDDFM